MTTPENSLNRLTAANLIVALVALFGGVVTGLFQALEHSGVNVYPSTPLVKSYYHSLTLHGVLNVLVWTTFFICGFVPFITTRALRIPLTSLGLAWGTFWLMTAGLVMAAIPLIGNAATVMFTFYPPLKAHWAFYVGLTLVVVGTWLVTLNLALTWRAWRRQNPGARTPLPAFMSLVTFAMWTIASLGIAAEMVLSTPLGFHHQYTDPGIQVGWKLVHAFLTFAVFFPSLLTFFNVVASLESGARARGGRGWVAWFGKLPWGDPSLAAQVLAMLLFTFGGIGGLINASYNLNLVVHNTAWMVGHLHLTVGTAVTLTFMGVSYWLVPHLAGRALWSRRLALGQVWSWFIGMIIFSNTLHRLGLMGMPRRTMIGAASYVQPEWKALLPLVGIGGSILFASSMLYFLNLILTLTASRAPAPAVPEFAEALSGADHAPAILDRWRPWLALAVLLIAIAYGPTLVRLAATTPLDVPGMRVW